MALPRNALPYSQEFQEEEIVPPSLSEIEPFLRAAAEVDQQRPRVAYLLRFHAFEKAHRLDPTSSGRGVRQFKTALLDRLERDNAPSVHARQRSTDAREIQSFYQQYYQNYIKVLDDAEHTDRAQLAQAYQTAGVLFEVLCAVNKTEAGEVAPEVIAQNQDIEEKQKMYAPYNILPLDASGASEAIMQLPEIMAAVTGLRNTRGLTPLTAAQREMYVEAREMDILDWLGAQFGFQKDNVANQREHLILLLANTHIRLRNPRPEPVHTLDDRAVEQILKKVLKNYKTWCKFLYKKNNLTLPTTPQEIQQRRLVYTALFLLIWGEAANLRFLPECLCYIFHNMAWEVIGMLGGNVSVATGQNIKPVYGGPDGSFLEKVISPIYETLAAEARSNGHGKAPHSYWRNYDDFNEFFWSENCFALGWPMKLDHPFFGKQIPWKRPGESGPKDKKAAKLKRPPRLGKLNFVEHRTFAHLYHSFERLWIFLILVLQAMIINAFNGPWHSFFTNLDVFKQVLTIFITEAGLRLVTSVLDVFLSIGIYKTMKKSTLVRIFLKIFYYLAWLIILPVAYVHSFEKANGAGGSIRSWFSSNWHSPTIFVAAVAIYLIPTALTVLLFILPWLKRWLENSNFILMRWLLWWAQEPLYVGRGMHESLFTITWYTLFWILLLLCKIVFSYFVMIMPLVKPTQSIIDNDTITYAWHELFRRSNKNIGAVLALWSPVVFVYFFDVQVWYAIFSTIVGGLIGAFQRLGEIRTLGMLRARFRSIPKAFNEQLVPADKRPRRFFSLRPGYAELDKPTREAAKFGQLWNELISSLREEDLISNREMDLMQVPYASSDLAVVQWPPFLLASKVPVAVQMAAQHQGSDADLRKKIKGDEYMRVAVEECYASFRHILDEVVKGETERWVVNALFHEVDVDLEKANFVATFNLKFLPKFVEKVVDFLKLLLEPDPSKRSAMIRVLQDMFEVVTKDMLIESAREELERPDGPLAHGKTSNLFALLEPKPAVSYPPPASSKWLEQLKRFSLLLTIRESAMDVPSNLEAQRRLTFFTNSLFMEMPRAPRVRYMQSFCVMTPYYSEDVQYTRKQLHEENEDGVSILFYLQKIYPDEWQNFLERTGCSSEEGLLSSEDTEKELRLWTSFRGQTLTRTARGMSYYRRALQLQAFLDMASEDEFHAGYQAVLQAPTEVKKNQRSIWAQLQAVADMKFTYVVTAQIYGQQRRSGDNRAADIFDLLKTHECLRVAYIDEVEREEKGKTKKEYFSVLIKAEQGLEREVYRIQLPGPAKIGEGKPENQNHAIVFSRGEALQTIDMNQDNYLEEAFKMRNLLEEFDVDHGVRKPTILGVREHIFTGSVSSLAWFMSLQELSFVTIGQRVLATPLKVRFHYGHPDVFDRLFHITRGGISKASQIINISEDIFVGFQTTLRRGNVTHHEYIQVGKGRDVGLNQISLFEAKVASGNGEQTLSRDIFRLGRRFDFFRMMSTYYTTIGFYCNTMVVVLTVYAFLYGRVYMALSGVEKSLLEIAKLKGNNSLQAALVSQSLVQLGLLLALPMVMELGLERGFRTAAVQFVIMQLQLSSVFFTFSLGTKTHYYGRTLLHGGAKYRATGRGFVVRHEKFAENYRLYSRSHFIKAFEIMFLLIVYLSYSVVGASTAGFVLVTISMWFLVFSWLFAPFLFNPSGFEWQKTVEDWEDWLKWISSRGGIGVNSSQSWESWWEEEQEHLATTGIWGRTAEVVLALRFLLYQYGVVYHLDITSHRRNIWVYLLSWVVILGALVVLKAVGLGRQRLSSDLQLLFRLLKATLFLAIVTGLGLLWGLTSFSISDLFASLLAFVPTGWFIIQVSLALRPATERLGFWESIKSLSRSYEYAMGLLIFTPVAVLAWFPFVSEFQTRLLFNQAFSRGLQISRILAGRKKN